MERTRLAVTASVATRRVAHHGVSPLGLGWGIAFEGLRVQVETNRRVGLAPPFDCPLFFLRRVGVDAYTKPATFMCIAPRFVFVANHLFIDLSILTEQ